MSEVPGIADGPAAGVPEAAAPSRPRRTGTRQAAAEQEAAAEAAAAAAAAAAAMPEKPASGGLIVTKPYMYHRVAVMRSQDSPLGQAETDLPLLFRAAVTSTGLKKPRSRGPAAGATPLPAPAPVLEPVPEAQLEPEAQKGRRAKAARSKGGAPKNEAPAPANAEEVDPDVAQAWRELSHLLPAMDAEQPPLAVVSSPAFLSALADFQRLLGAGMWDPHAVSGGGNARMGTYFGRLLSEPTIDMAQWCTQRPETGSRSRGRRGDISAAGPSQPAAPPALPAP